MKTIFALLFLLATGPVLATFDVRDFGAVGDGVTDDTAAFMSALSDAARPVALASPLATLAFASGNVEVPAGVYRLSGPLYIPTQVSLIGDGRGSTALQFSGDGLHMQGAHIEVTGLSLVGDGIGTGITVAKCRMGCSIRDSFLTGFETHIKAEESWTLQIVGNHLRAATGDGIRLRHATAGLISGNRIDYGERGIVVLAPASGLTISNNQVQGHQQEAIVLRGASTTLISGNFFERNNLAGGSPHIRIIGGGKTTLMSNYMTSAGGRKTNGIIAVRKKLTLLGNMIQDGKL